MAESFSGFPKQGFDFFKQLARHNNREWFLAHKETYERACRAPLQSLAAAFELRFGKAKVTRIHRDLRFSRGQPPYKSYIAAGLGGRYISLAADGVWVGAGLYMPDAKVLQRLRAAIADNVTGRELAGIVRALRRKGYEVGSHETLASAPRGYPRDHPRLELLRMKDIYAGRQFAPAAWLSTPSARERIERVLTDTAPLVSWFTRHVTGTHAHERRQ
jgi:uncharacterized protein (TIGR02453 family)